MATPESIKKVIATTTDSQKLKEAYSAIVRNLSNQTTHRAGLETLVICSETALKVGNLDVAKRCLETYFLEVRRYDSTLKEVEVKDQYLCRAHYSLGKLVSEQSKRLKGKPLVDGTLESIKHVMKGLEIAASNPRYLFLVYNGSVHHWHVSRPLQCAEMRKHMLPSMEKVVVALEKVAGQEEWKVRCLMNLALCQLDAGNPSEGEKTLQRGYDMAVANKLDVLQKEVAVLQVHLSTAGGGGGGKKGGGGGKAKPADAKKGAKGGAGGGPAVLDEEGALRMIQAVMTGKSAEGSEAELMAAVAKVDPNPGSPAKNANLAPVARAAWAAAHLGLNELAETWASRAAGAQELSTRIWSDMTRVLLSLKVLPPVTEGGEKLKKSILSVHLKAMDSMEDVVTAFMKLKDVEGIHEASRLIWNAGLILLQPELRRKVKRSFNSAAKALEVIGSPLYRLRVQLHLEAAKCDAAEESLIKASQEVQNARSLNYVAPEEEKKRFQLERPLDRYLDPLFTALSLRTSLTQEPESAEEEAVLLIERSKETRNPSIKRDLLSRGIEKLSELPLLAPPKADYNEPDRAALQVSCRRRTVIWAELIRSAWGGGATGPNMHMEDIVRTAAPYCLDMAWAPDVDREMVLLQAQISFIEAGACVIALKAAHEEVVPLVGEAPPDVDDRSLRLPSVSVNQLQHLFLTAVLRGMSFGLSIKEPFLVINGGVTAWNTYLPIMHQHRYAELLKMLAAAMDILLQLTAEESDGSLVCGMAEAYAKATEHKLLLTMLVDDADQGLENESDDGNGGVPVAKGFRFNGTPGYEVLPMARVKTASMDFKAKPAATSIVADEFPVVCKVCEESLSKAGNAQSQSLFESYARLQQLRGAAVAIPAGTAATSEATSKVVGIIENVARVGGSTPQGQADIKSAMEILSGLPAVNVELWSKLARACAAPGTWPMALECAKAAASAIPAAGGGMDISAVRSPSDVPELHGPNVWFWLAVAECVHGQAINAMISKGQDTMVQLSLGYAAMLHFQISARLASFVKKADLMETVAQLAWSTSIPFMKRPLLSSALVTPTGEGGPLGGIVAEANHFGCADTTFQLRLNCLYIECLCCARKWDEALSACDAACAAVSDKRMHRSILSWKGLCLSQGAGDDVQKEMFKVKEYIPEYQAHTWSVIAHHSSARYDQMEALTKSLAVVNKQPWVKAQYFGEFAEWLISSGLNDGEATEDLLLMAADAIMEFDMGEEDGDSDEEEDFGAVSRRSKLEDLNASLFDDKKSTSGSGGRNKFKKKKNKIRLGIATGEATLDPNQAPTKLTTPLLERFMRVFIMLSEVAVNAEDHNDYLLTAHHYALRIMTSAIYAAYRVPKAPPLAPGETPPPPPEQYEPMPNTLVGWGLYRFSPAMLAKLGNDKSVLAINKEAMPEAELTLAYLELLISSMRKRGLEAHTLPLYQLLSLVAKLAVRSEAVYQACQLGLINTLDTVGLSEEASAKELEMGDYWTITQEERDQCLEQKSFHAVVHNVSKSLGGLRSSMNVGRLSFLGNQGQGSSIRTGRKLNSSASFPEASLPQWITNAAREMTSGNHSSGVGNTRDNAVNVAAGSIFSHVRSLLMLRPLTLHDSWLRKGDHLIRRGRYGVAKELLMKARDHAQWSDNSESEARALLGLCRCESLVNRFSDAITRLQEAQRLGGDYDFWQESISTYVDARLAAPHTTTSDARDALQGGIAMFTTIARDDRAAEKAASIAGAALKLHLSRLLLYDMVTMRSQGIFNWQKNFEQAVTLCNQAIASLAARSAGIPQIEALLHQAILMMEDPAPVKDMRLRFKKIERILVNAEEMASKFFQSAAPRDLDTRVSLPVARLLAQVRLALAELRLSQARQRDIHFSEDRNKDRPRFPKVRGKEEAVIIEFIDSMEDETEGETLSPEDEALTLSVSAATWNCPLIKAKGLLLAGKCLLYKYLLAAPKPMHPWPDKSFPPGEAPELGTQPGDCASLDGGFETGGRLSMYGGIVAPRLSTFGGPMGGEAVRGAPSQATIEEGVEEDEEMEEAKDEMALVDPALASQVLSCHAQCVDLLQESLKLALSINALPQVEACALELARGYGQKESQLAAHYFCLAGSAKSASHMLEILKVACPVQQPEALARKQERLLSENFPMCLENHSYKKVRAMLDLAGVSTKYTTLEPAAATPTNSLAFLPDDLRVLLLYVSASRDTLYLAAINIPDPNLAVEPPPTDGKKPDKNAPPPVVPKVSIVDAMSLDPEQLDSIKAAVRSHRRTVERQIRESVAAAALRIPEEPVAKEVENKKGSKAPKTPPKSPPVAKSPEPTVEEKSATPKSAFGGKRSALSSPNKGPRVPYVKEPVEKDDPNALFPPVINREYAANLKRLEKLLEPLMVSIKKAVPDVTLPPPPLADGEGKDCGDAPAPPSTPMAPAKGAPAKGGGKKGTGEVETTGPRSRVVVLLDPELSQLPFEALSYFKNNCSSFARCPSLHQLKASTENVPSPAECTFDISSLGYIVDPVCEGSAPEQATGPFNTPLISTFKSTLLSQAPHKDWFGITGTLNRVPAEAEYIGLLAKAPGLVFLGMGRFLSYLPASLISSVDLRQCNVAILTGRVNNSYAHHRQVYLDNRKSKKERNLEGSVATAELCLARGVKTVVVGTMATTADANCALLSSIFEGLHQGLDVAESVWKALASLKHDLNHVSSSTIVMGVPFITAGGSVKGGKGGKKK